MERWKSIWYVCQVPRLILLPFPFAYVAGSVGQIVSDRILHGPPEAIIQEPGVQIGGYLLFVFSVLLTLACQVMLGVPSLLVLDRLRSGPIGYAVTGVVSAVVCSVGYVLSPLASALPGTFSGRFLDALMWYGAPLILAYLLAGALHSVLREKTTEPIKRLESNAGMPPPSSGRSTAVEHRLPGVSQP